MSNLLTELNESQREAVLSTEGYIRVVAGAGSGKTRALTYRFAHLINDIGILPGNILCVTFTNKSANEMRQRIHSLTGDNDTGYINTFHGFCVSVLQEDISSLGYPKSFFVLDNEDINDMLRIIYDERNLSLRDMSFSKARDMFEMLKLKERPDYYLDLINLPQEELYRKYETATEIKDILFYGYLYQEKKTFALDYNDLILFTLFMFREHEDIRKKWQQRLEYIMIDEFQDIDPPQYELMRVLAAYHGNLFVVGDPDQTIYTWRGADVRYLLDFDKAFPNVKTIMMNENYRSSGKIIAVANSLISKNQNRIYKDLMPMRDTSEKDVICHMSPSPDKEAEYIAGEILDKHAKSMRFGDMTIMYRAHYVSRNLEEALLKNDIPYTIYSGVQFFERREIKDSLAYLRMAAFRDDLSFRRIINVPKRNIGMRRMKILKEYAEKRNITLYEALKEISPSSEFSGTDAEEFIKIIDEASLEAGLLSVSDLLNNLLVKSGYENMLRTEGDQVRLDNISELKQSVFDYERTSGEESDLASYLRHISLFSNTDLIDVSDRVKLMTVHSAKGLEFPVVFLAGLNEGIFPSGKTRTLESMEEERRLCFVALTRAMDELYLTEAEGNNLNGSRRWPSRFILDIDEDRMVFSPKLDEQLVKNTLSYVKNSDLKMRSVASDDIMAPGTRIRHKVFGEGVIIEADTENMRYVIRFDSLTTPRGINMRVPLEKI